MAQRGAWLAAALLAIATVAGVPAAGQDIMVDGERMTAHDIDQRIRLDQLATHRTPSRQQVIDELTSELFLIHRLNRLGTGPSDADIDEAFAKIAARLHLTAHQLIQAFVQQGIDARALQRWIRSELARQQYWRPRNDPVSSRQLPGESVPSIDPRWGEAFGEDGTLIRGLLRKKDAPTEH